MKFSLPVISQPFHRSPLRQTAQLFAIMLVFVGFVESQNYPAPAVSLSSEQALSLSADAKNATARSIAYATTQLEHTETFVPFGTATYDNGTIGLDKVRDRHPNQTNLDIASSLVQLYHQAALEHTIRASAVAYDAVIPNENGANQHAIAVLYDDRAHTSIRLYYPYTRVKNNLVISAPHLFLSTIDPYACVNVLMVYRKSYSI
jgi:hypothetical protein